MAPPRKRKMSVPDMLRQARARRGAVGAFNIYNIEGALAVVRAAEEVGEAVILQLHPASMDFGGTALIAACREVAAKSRVPIAIQLDHAQSESSIRAALEAGVDAVLADGSHLALEENAKWTQKMVELAHAKGASVEAELGKLAGEEDGLSVPEAEAKMTDPNVVADFLATTGVDALAVTIGNVHGNYATPNPKLDFARLDRIRAAAGDIPLVLHGASGLPEATVREAIARSCCKFNVNTEVRSAAKKAIADGSAKGLDVLDLMKTSMNAMIPVIEQKIRLFASRPDPVRICRSITEMDDALPPPWHENERVLQLRCGTLAARANSLAPLPVVDDDPTGTQTVHSVPVLGDWTVPTLVPVVTMDRPCFYILSNTRALPESEAAARAEEIGRNLREAAAAANIGSLSAVVSRGDSTLRGHFPAETIALARGLGWGAEGSDIETPVVILAPFFKEGGRLTAFDIHYVAGPPGSSEDGSAKLMPAGDTEFARDRAFSYTASNLAEYVREKYSKGDYGPTPKVYSVSLETIRRGGPDAVADIVSAASSGSVVILNSVIPRDMQVAALGCLKAELARGAKRPLLYRSAGALVSARAAIPARDLLTSEELAPSGGTSSNAGLIVVGSYVGKSTDQLGVLLRQCPWLTTVELNVTELAAGEAGRMEREKARAQNEIIESLAQLKSVVMFTSRKVLQDDGAGGLHIGARVNDALCDITEMVLTCKTPPAFLVAKGGITSNDIAVRSLGVRRAEVMGAIVPGVPVWRCGPETRSPGLAYIVFPGNVGAVDDLARVACKVSGNTMSNSEEGPRSKI